MLDAIPRGLRRLAVAFALAFLGSLAALRAQCVGQWEVDGTNGLSGPVAHAVVWDPDGAGPVTQRLVVAGPFSSRAMAVRRSPASAPSIR